MKKLQLLVAPILFWTVALLADPAPEMGSIFSPDGVYDIGKASDLRPGSVFIKNALAVSGVGAGAINLGDGTVTQITSITTAVTVNASSGVITTFSAATGALAVQSFTVNDSAVAAGSAVQVTIVNYGGTYFTNGTPYVTVSSIAGGSFTINILNLHTANALSGVLKIAFAVL